MKALEFSHGFCSEVRFTISVTRQKKGDLMIACELQFNTHSNLQVYLYVNNKDWFSRTMPL